MLFCQFTQHSRKDDNTFFVTIREYSHDTIVPIEQCKESSACVKRMPVAPRGLGPTVNSLHITKIKSAPGRTNYRVSHCNMQRGSNITLTAFEHSALKEASVQNLGTLAEDCGCKQLCVKRCATRPLTAHSSKPLQSLSLIPGREFLVSELKECKFHTMLGGTGTIMMVHSCPHCHYMKRAVWDCRTGKWWIFFLVIQWLSRPLVTPFSLPLASKAGGRRVIFYS